jgi:hypothetical protein
MAWQAPNEGRAGLPPVFSDAAIKFGPSIRVLLKLPLRRTAEIHNRVAFINHFDALAPPRSSGRTEPDGIGEVAPEAAFLRQCPVDRARLLDQGGYDLRGPFLEPDDLGTVRPPAPLARSPEGDGHGRGEIAGVSEARWVVAELEVFRFDCLAIDAFGGRDG